MNSKLAQKIKVTFSNETKSLKKVDKYETLIQAVQKAFGSSLPQYFKFHYTDDEGDNISVSCQEDLDEAYDSMESLKLIIEESNIPFNFPNQINSENVSYIEQISLPCFKCEGKKMILKNNMHQICSKCKGSGKSSIEFQDSMINSIKELIKQEAQIEDKSITICSQIIQPPIVFIQQEEEQKQILEEIIITDIKESQQQTSALIDIVEIKNDIIQEPISIFQDIKKSDIIELTEEEKMKIAYMEELEQAQINIPELKQNLKEMCEMGYFNYKVNYNLLVRNSNNLEIAINKMCSYSIADSVFNQ